MNQSAAVDSCVISGAVMSPNVCTHHKGIHFQPLTTRNVRFQVIKRAHNSPIYFYDVILEPWLRKHAESCNLLFTFSEGKILEIHQTSALQWCHLCLMLMSSLSFSFLIYAGVQLDCVSLRWQAILNSTVGERIYH